MIKKPSYLRSEEYQLKELSMALLGDSANRSFDPYNISNDTLNPSIKKLSK
jgi:hypothetical protein